MPTKNPQAPTRATKTPPLLFLHGFRSSHESMIDLAVWLLDQGYECYYPDLPPFGQVQKELEAYDADHYAKFVADYIKEHFDANGELDKHPERRPILIGFSMGSLIAAATAAKYPDLVSDKLILLAPISDLPSGWLVRFQPLATLLPNRLVSYVFAKHLAVIKTSPTYQETLRALCASSKNYLSRKGVRAAAKFSSTHKISDFDFHKHTLIIAGDNDKLIPRQHTDILAKTLRERSEQGNTPYTVSLGYIKDGGHLLNYEYPHKTAELVLDFLDKNF